MYSFVDPRFNIFSRLLCTVLLIPGITVCHLFGVLTQF